ncbi:MAG: hypothetical protein LM550_07680 [Candidatus Contendobacter sp.]|jgi:hypothetical protein|nr:hypothetical protein [Gammaproteobacteria bacterium]MCC8993554.1 hypothetical protein [Candidatus Contendobacter sp.]
MRLCQAAVIFMRIHLVRLYRKEHAARYGNDVFLAAERQAKWMQKSRTQFYAAALIEYLARHASDGVTEAMNKVIEQLGESQPDPFLTASARRVFERSEW